MIKLLFIKIHMSLMNIKKLKQNNNSLRPMNQTDYKLIAKMREKINSPVVLIVRDKKINQLTQSKLIFFHTYREMAVMVKKMQDKFEYDMHFQLQN